MAIGKSNVFGKISSIAPVFWFLVLQPWRLLIYIWWLLLVLIRMVIYLVVGLFLLGWFPIILFFAGTLLLPLTTSQNEFYNAAEDVGTFVVDIVDDIINLVQELLDCKEILVEFWNTWMRFLASVIKRIFNAVNDFLNLGLPTIFSWADRAHRAEQALMREELENEISRLIDVFEAEVRTRTKTIDPKYRAAYLEMMNHKVHRLARARVMGRNTLDSGGAKRITLIPSAFCNLLDGIFDFLLGLLDIFGDFFLDFLDAILGFFDLVNGDFDESFIFILVRFLIVEILTQIPFTACFVNPDDLQTTPIDEIPDLLADQLPQRLISCLCPWRYENPIGFPPFLAGNQPDGDQVPENLGAALIGCICFNPNVEIETSDDPIDLLIRCLGVDVLIAAFENFVNILENVWLVVFNALKAAFEWLQGAYQSLLSAFQSLLSFAQDLLDLLRRRRRGPDGMLRDVYGNILPEDSSEDDLADLERKLQEAGNFVETLEGWTKTLQNARRSIDLRREFVDEYERQQNQTYIRKMREHKAYAPLKRIVSPITQQIVAAMNKMRNNFANITGSVSDPEVKARMTERFARMFEALPEDHRLKKLREHVQERYGPESGQDAAKLQEVFRQTVEAGAWSIRTKADSFAIAAHLDQIDFEGLVDSVFRLSRVVRERRNIEQGTPRSEPVRKLETLGKVWLDANLRPDNLHRTIKALEIRYGKQDKAVRGGILAAARHASSSKSLQEVLERYDIGIEEVEHVGKQAHERAKEKKKENKSRMKEIFDVATYAQEEWTLYQSAVTHAWHRTSEEPGPKRVLVIGITITAGAAISVVSIAGFALGVGLSFLVTLLVAVLGPLLLVIVLFFTLVIQFVVQIAVGLISNTFKSDDGSPSFDWFTPYILVTTDLVAQSFVDGYQLSDLQDTVSDYGDITVDNLQWVLSFAVRNRLCSIPLKLEPYTCPRLPKLDQDGRPDESFVDWLLGSTIYFPQDAPCLDSEDCDGGDCVCPGDPSRLGTLDAPCAGVGYCNGWPLIRERIGIRDYEIDIEVDPQCDKVLDFDLEGLKYYNDPDFKKYGVSIDWFLSPGFRVFLRSMFSVWYGGLKFIVRRIVLGGFIRWQGMFTVLGGSLWFVPSFTLKLLAVLTIVANTLTEYTQEAGIYVLGIADDFSDLPRIGPFFQELGTWGRFDNYQDFPPFGKPRVVDWVCVIGNLPPIMMVTAAVIWFLSMLLGLLVAGGIAWVIFFFLDILLFPVNMFILIMRILLVNAILYRRKVLYATWSALPPARVISSGMPEAGERRAVLRRSKRKRKQAWGQNREPVKGRHPLSKAGLDMSSQMAELEGKVFFRRRADQHLNRFTPGTQPMEAKTLPWGKSFLHAGHSTLMGLPSAFSPGGMKHVWKHGPLALRHSFGVNPWTSPSAEKDNIEDHRYVVFDEHVPDEFHGGMPISQYIFTHEGRSILEDPHIVVGDRDAMYLDLDDEDTAIYEHMSGERIQ